MSAQRTDAQNALSGALAHLWLASYALREGEDKTVRPDTARDAIQRALRLLEPLRRSEALQVSLGGSSSK